MGEMARERLDAFGIGQGQQTDWGEYDDLPLDADGDAYGDDETPTAERFEPVSIPNPLKLLQMGSGVLSKTEAAMLRPFLLDAVRGYSDELDNWISRTNRAKTQIAPEHDNLIWSDLEDREIETLVDGMLIVGQRNKQAAAAVRGIARTWRMVEAGLILGPRFLKTVRFYADNGGLALW